MKRINKNKEAGAARIKFYVLFVVSVLITSLLIYVVLYSNFFKLSTLEVQNSIFYERSDFVDNLSTEIVSSNKYLGLLSNKNVLFWYFAGDEIIEPKKFQSLEKISINTDIATKYVSIKVEEHDFKGVICKSDTDCYGLNEAGVVYTKAPYVEGNLIFKIDDRSSRSLVLGHKFLPKDQWIERMFKTIDLLKKQNIGIKSVYIKDINLKEWGLNLFSGPDIYFSFDFVPENLNQVVESFFKQSGSKSYDYIDLRIPGRIYYK